MALDPISNVAEAAAKIISLFKADPNIKANASVAIDEARLNGEIQQVLGQLDVNKAEASNASLFVAGWRPAVGWTCAAGLASQFLIGPMSTWVASLLGHPIVYPSLDMGTLLTLLMGMLGLGGMRTYEKVQNAAQNH
ncbi:MAG: hypothetical protein KGL39_14225 [Patescibacteria group bacterium]|nr:hypothetical protein [Patescibacteria group bacterium]